MCLERGVCKTGRARVWVGLIESGCWCIRVQVSKRILMLYIYVTNSHTNSLSHTHTFMQTVYMRSCEGSTAKGTSLSRTQSHICTHTHTNARTHMHTYTCTHTCTRIRTYTHTHTHTSTHTHTRTMFYVD